VHRYLVRSLSLCGHFCFAQECPAPQPATPAVIHVTKEEYVEASLKVRLIHLLTQSLIDQGRGMVDIPREREIQKLMKQLKEESYDSARTLRRGEVKP
jgi:hypothetical protein